MVCWPARMKPLAILDLAPHHLLLAVITGLAALSITIPLTRLVDILLARQRAKREAGAML